MVGEKIKITDSMADVLIKLSEGDPEAFGVCIELSKQPHGVVYLLDLDDMGIRGSSIWLAFKDFAGQDIRLLIKALESRDPKMVSKIRAVGGRAWTGGRS